MYDVRLQKKDQRHITAIKLNSRDREKNILGKTKKQIKTATTLTKITDA